ncbi:hypothetical protein ACTTAI_08915 [Rhodobacter capsulatus]|uniref:hypothetical protein n=1 Tax=Rhodobacter capsulatus TaxID=1061 RepID=UPI004027238A
MKLQRVTLRTALRSNDLAGIPGLPTSRMGIWKWLKRKEIPLIESGGCYYFQLSDLPNQVRLSFLAHRAEAMGLAMGEHDDAAHVALAAKPLGVQNTAYARAETMMFVAKHRAAGLTDGQIAQHLQTEAAKTGAAILAPSCATLDRWSKAIAGIAPINWAPALAPKYQGRTVTAEVSPEAWAEFETLLGLAGKNGTGWPLKEAWQKIEEQKAARGCGKLRFLPGEIARALCAPAPGCDQRLAAGDRRKRCRCDRRRGRASRAQLGIKPDRLSK